MAIVTRYFSTTGAGAADGTTWADRAALFSAGNWSTVITGFSFAGSDSLEARVGPGTYTCSQALASGLFASAPAAVRPLFLFGCDSSGNRLTPPDSDWDASIASWTDSNLPVIATTTNISTINLANCFLRLLKFTASGATTNAALNSAAALDWCVLEHSGSNTSAVGVSASVLKLSQSVISMSGSSFRAAALWGGSPQNIHNCKFLGVTGSSGNRHGIEFTGSANGYTVERCYIAGFGGDGIGTSASGATNLIQVRHCVIRANGGTGIKLNATASQTAHHQIESNMITGNGAWGIDAQSTAYALITNNRLRDNSSGNINGTGNYPTDLENHTTDSDDATEYVDTSTHDVRIKNTAAIWGSGYGIADQAASGTTLVGVIGG